MPLLSVGLVVAGLLFCYLCAGVKQALLATIVYWAGVVLVVVGLVLLVAPAIVWLASVFRSMLGV